MINLWNIQRRILVKIKFHINNKFIKNNKLLIVYKINWNNKNVLY
jgi:hypothetical protein